MVRVLEGIPASSGIAIAKAYRLENPDISVVRKTVLDTREEVERLEAAIRKARAELEMIRASTSEAIGEDEAAIFTAHLLVLSDPELLNPVREKIEAEQVNAEYALQEVAGMFIGMFESMDNEYMRERAADIRDVTKRVTAHLLGVHIPNLNLISEEVIVVAEDLTPSDTARLNRKYVKGFTTNTGGRTSHSAIMARSQEIPAVVGTKSVMAEIKNGDMIIVDGFRGRVIINPPHDIIEEYKHKLAGLNAQMAEWIKLKNERTRTKDGYSVELAANIGTPADVKSALENGAEGIGLFRTEFLYMERDNPPSEGEQFEAYKTVLERMGDKPVVVRTLDIGGDKELSYVKISREMNPFLGFRAIRLCLEMQELFRTQLRALLRASIFGNLKIMFPMIATLDEFRQAKAMLLDEKAKLHAEGIPVADVIEVGMMVETPAAAILADQFAKEVDFFSIGTNDLIQYTLAADRMNERVSYLYQPYNPAILRLISRVIDAAHEKGKWVGMCGEMAGDALAIPVLLGLGLDEFSMSATSILQARSQIKDLSKEETSALKEKILNMRAAEEVVSFIKQAFHVT